MTTNRRTPWGQSDSVTIAAEGITFYGTPSHGGYLLSQDRRDSMPPNLFNFQTFAGGNWYEEDCDWAVVCMAFPDAFPPDALPAAIRTAQGCAVMGSEDPRFDSTRAKWKGVAEYAEALLSDPALTA